MVREEGSPWRPCHQPVGPSAGSAAPLLTTQSPGSRRAVLLMRTHAAPEPVQAQTLAPMQPGPVLCAQTASLGAGGQAQARRSKRGSSAPALPAGWTSHIPGVEGRGTARDPYGWWPPSPNGGTEAAPRCF